jgi:hypothetical protein
MKEVGGGIVAGTVLALGRCAPLLFEGSKHSAGHADF